jgi:hypothetical protein
MSEQAYWPSELGVDPSEIQRIETAGQEEINGLNDQYLRTVGPDWDEPIQVVLRRRKEINWACNAVRRRVAREITELLQRTQAQPDLAEASDTGIQPEITLAGEASTGQAAA